MKITLNTQELNQAVVEYLSNQGLNIDTNKVSIMIDEEGVTIDTAANTNAPQKSKKEKKSEPKAVSESVTENTAEVVPEAPVSSSVAEVEAADAAVVKSNTSALFSFSEHTDNVLEDDTPQIPKENIVEKTRKLFT